MDPWRLFSFFNLASNRSVISTINLEIAISTSRLMRRYLESEYSSIIELVVTSMSSLHCWYLLFKMAKCKNYMEDVRDICPSVIKITWRMYETHGPSVIKKDSLDLSRTDFWQICSPNGAIWWQSHFSNNRFMHLILACFHFMLWRH